MLNDTEDPAVLYRAFHQFLRVHMAKALRPNSGRGGDDLITPSDWGRRAVKTAHFGPMVPLDPGRGEE